jgi:hypothetical protein
LDSGLDGCLPQQTELLRGGPGDRADSGKSLFEFPCCIGQGKRSGNSYGSGCENGQSHPKLPKGGSHAVRTAGDALVQTRKSPFETLHFGRSQIPRRKDESKSHGIERHLLPPFGCLFYLPGLLGALLPYAFEKPVPIQGRHFQGFPQINAKTAAAMLSPAQMKQPFPPDIHV